MSVKFKNNLIGIVIFVGALVAINIWRGPPDMSLRNQSLNEMVRSSLTRFRCACQQLWGDRGPQENCTKESLSNDAQQLRSSRNQYQWGWQSGRLADHRPPLHPLRPGLYH